MNLNETIAYPKKLCSLNWRFPSGTWVTKFKNNKSHLVIFCNTPNIDDITVLANNSIVSGTAFDLSTNSFIDYKYGVSKYFAYVYTMAYGYIEIRVKDEGCKNSISIFAFNEKYEQEDSSDSSDSSSSSDSSESSSSSESSDSSDSSSSSSESSDSSDSSSSIITETVVIGGKTYSVVSTPDGRDWLGENLDYAWNELTVGEDTDIDVSTPKAWYFNNDEETYGWLGRRCGLLYNSYAIEYLEEHRNELLPSGWRVPTSEEWQGLISSMSNTDIKARNVIWEQNWGGADTYGFAMLPGGVINDSGFTNVYALGSQTTFGVLATSSFITYDDTQYYQPVTSGTRKSASTYLSRKYGLSLRLIRDLT